MKLWVLSENTAACPDLAAEHGLSIYLEACGRRILFDTGRSENFAENAKKMGVDLSAVDLAILSHGHYDHGGGIRRFLQENDHAPVYISRHAFERHFAPDREIGLDPSLEGESRLIPCEGELPLGDGLTLFSCNERPRPYGTDSCGMTFLLDGRQVTEDFRHEQYLLVEENGRRVLLSGCSHKGILNIMDWFRPDVLVGGFHFMKLDVDQAADRQRLLDSAKTLLDHGAEYYTCHCTGLAQYAFLREQMGERLHYAATGDILEL